MNNIELQPGAREKFEPASMEIIIFSTENAVIQTSGIELPPDDM